MKALSPFRERRLAIQLKPNWMPGESRLCLTRLYWNRGTPGDGKGYSSKVSVSIQWKWQDLWVGAFWKRGLHEWHLWICLLPCLPIRIHRVTSYGGRFI